MNAPIITWLNKCFINKTLDKATSTDEAKKIKLIEGCLRKRWTKVEKRKKFNVWLDGIPVKSEPHFSIIEKFS